MAARLGSTRATRSLAGKRGWTRVAMVGEFGRPSEGLADGTLAEVGDDRGGSA